MPLENFYVEKGFKYRFRLILNGVQHCPMEFSIESHNLTVIAGDGQPIEPFVVQSIFITSGKV
jgi:L-ascorbate oxidase